VTLLNRTRVRFVVDADPEAPSRLRLSVGLDEGDGDGFRPCVKRFELPTSTAMDAAWLDRAYVAAWKSTCLGYVQHGPFGDGSGERDHSQTSGDLRSREAHSVSKNEPKRPQFERARRVSRFVSPV